MHTVGSSSVAQGKPLESTDRSSRVAVVKPPGIGHDTVLAVPVIVPYTDHDTVLGEPVTLPCGCSAALEALERQLERAAGSASAVQANVPECERCENRVLTEQAILLARWAVVSKAVEARRHADSKALWLPVLVKAFHGSLWTTSSSTSRATSSS